MSKVKKCCALLVILLFLFSCGDSATDDINGGMEDGSNKETENLSDEGKRGDSAADRIEPDLPEKDFEGYTFTFLTHSGQTWDWVSTEPLELVAEEETGEPINDAVYRRNMQIMEKYNVEFEMILGGNAEVTALRRAVGAGDSMYDAAVIFNNNIPTAVTSDLLINIDSLPYVDLEKPWWDPAVNSMSIDNKNFLLGGDLLILDNEATNALLFSKKLTADLGLELPYKSVIESKWTMDKMNEMIRVAAADLDGDGMMGMDDRWGWYVYSDTLHALLVSGGGTLASKDENDIPYMDFASTINLRILEKAMDLMYNPDYVVNNKTSSFNADGAFREGRLLFMWVRMREVERLRDMESDFGIVPMPKTDDLQENYHSVVNPYTGVLLGVSKSAENLERVSIILEALSAESRYTLQPAYYDVVLTRKFARDEESEEMLDIIFNSRVYDIGAVYSFSGIFLSFIDLSLNFDRNVSSFYEARVDRMQAAIDKVVETFQAME